MTPYILMLALSVHSLFEGLAVGITPEISQVTSLVIGIGIHKGAAAISLGISLQRGFPNDFKRVFLLAFFFAIASPIGIVIGIFLQSASTMTDIVFSTLAAGTFLYIACSEVIVEEFALPGQRFQKYALFMTGAILITCLWFFG